MCSFFKKILSRIWKKIKCIENIITKDTIERFYHDNNEDIDFNNLPQRKYTLVSVGRVCSDKGVDFAIQVAELIKKEITEDFIWIWVGPDETNPQYLTLIDEKNVTDNFIFVGGKLNPYKYIEKADIVVHPARFEGKAVAVEETLVMNKPIVLTDYTTAINQVDHMKNGIIVEMNSEEIFKVIKKLLLNKKLREEIISYQKQFCLGNEYEIEKLYQLIG